MKKLLALLLLISTSVLSAALTMRTAAQRENGFPLEVGCE